MKSVDEGIARRHSHNDLVGIVADFSLHQSYTYVPPPLKKYKAYSCALPTINIPKDIWCELIFLSAETCVKNAWSLYHARRTCANLCTLK